MSDLHSIYEPILLANRIRTPDGTILQSFNRHDFKMHEDANGETYMNDGGLSYFRRSKNTVPAEELSVWSDDPHEVIREATHWGTYGKDGKQPLTYVAIMDMTTEHIQACLDNIQTMHPAFRTVMQNELEYRRVKNVGRHD